MSCENLSFGVLRLEIGQLVCLFMIGAINVSSVENLGSVKPHSDREGLDPTGYAGSSELTLVAKPFVGFLIILLIWMPPHTEVNIRTCLIWSKVCRCTATVCPEHLQVALGV